jgi:hypothetical protein
MTELVAANRASEWLRLKALVLDSARQRLLPYQAPGVRLWCKRRLGQSRKTR